MYVFCYRAPLTSLASKGVLKPFSLWCNQVRICWLMYYYQSLFYVTDYIMLCMVLNKMNWTELNWSTCLAEDLTIFTNIFFFPAHAQIVITHLSIVCPSDRSIRSYFPIWPPLPTFCYTFSRINLQLSWISLVWALRVMLSRIPVLQLPVRIPPKKKGLAPLAQIKVVLTWPKQPGAQKQ